MKRLLWLILILAAIAGMIAGLFLPTATKESVEPFLRIATIVSLTVTVGMWWLSTRLRRTHVSSLEKFARRILFKKAA